MKVIDLKAEKLTRLAFDYAIYYQNFSYAQRLLNSALKLSPLHFKALMYKADFFFFTGNIKCALKFYEKALKIQPKNPKILASLANCHETSGQYKEALKFINSAFCNMQEGFFALSPSMFELKISALNGLKRFNEAQKVLTSARGKITDTDLNHLYSTYKKSYEKTLNGKLISFSL